MKNNPPYERCVLAGIEMDVRKEETLYFARSPRWVGFMITARTLEALEEKLPSALQEYEELVASGERDREVLKAFATLRSEQESCATRNVGTNHDPERIMTLQAIRLLCATLWPHDFATKEEMAMVQSKWDAQTDSIIQDMAG